MDKISWWATQRPSLFLELSGLPNRLWVGRGLAVPVHLRCFDLENAVERATLTIGGVVSPLIVQSRRHEIYRPTTADPLLPVVTGYFEGPVSLVPPPCCGEAVPRLLTVFFCNGEEVNIDLGACDYFSAPPRVVRPAPRRRVHLTAVCMAVWRPPPRRFRLQLQSILAQSHRHTIVYINDDDPHSRLLEREPLLRHPRVFYERNKRRLGFYHNFERVLGRVPETTSFVALADQDDVWHPDKLKRSLAALADRDLVFSDMRVRSEFGTVLSPSAWSGKLPHLDDIDALLTRNCVTGAATVMRAETLRAVLPFPPAISQVFHDHWIACCAALGRGIGFLPHPLYDYVQHGNNLVGHTIGSWPDFRAFLRTLALLMAKTFLRRQGIGPVLDYLWSRVAVYHSWYFQIALMLATLTVRFPARSRQLAPARDMFAGGYRSFVPLMLASLRFRRKGQDTLCIEQFLASGIAADFIWWKVFPLFRRAVHLKRRLLTRLKGPMRPSESLNGS